LLAGLRLGARELLAVAAVLVIVDVFAGWSYLASYFLYFRIPTEGVGISLPEMLGQGLRTVLLPLTVIVVAAAAPGRRLRNAAIGAGVYLLFLTAVALVTHWASPGAVLVQLAGAVVTAAIVFGMRMGIGGKPIERLLIGAAGLLLLVSIPVASGTLDAGQTASAKLTTLRVVTTSPLLPSAVPAGGSYIYTNYVLLRENDTRYWLFRIGDHYAYSISKGQVVYIRY
jgi:uncharacterized membrane protein YhaH (DUF805 family)